MKNTDMELMKKKHTKKEIRAINNCKRVIVRMDTGTKAFKSPKNYDRRLHKAEVRKMITEH